MSWMTICDPKEDTLKVSVQYIHKKCVKKGGSLEDVDGFRQETWRTGSSLMSCMTLFDLNEYTLKVSH